MEFNSTFWNGEESTKKLIELVREAGLHFDKKNKDYKFPDKKLKMFVEFAGKLGLPTTDAAGEFLSMRWKYLRETFGSALREPKLTPSGSAKKIFKKDTWEFYGDLEFLIPHIVGRKTQSNLQGASGIQNPKSQDSCGSQSSDPDLESAVAFLEGDKSLDEFLDENSGQSASTSSVSSSAEPHKTSSDPPTPSGSGSSTFKPPLSSPLQRVKRARYAANESHMKLNADLASLDSQIEAVVASAKPVILGPDEAVANDLKAVLLSVQDEIDRQGYRLKVRGLIMEIELEELKKKRERKEETQH